MTIAVGLLADNCVILAADTQETYGTAKVKGDKILVLRSERPESFGTVAITGAGDADYLDRLAQDVMAAYLKHRTGPLEKALDRTLAAFYRAHVQPLGSAWAEERSFSITAIVAFQRDGRTKLLASPSGGIAFKDAGPYVARGTGESAARNVLRELYRDGLSREAAMRLAAYAVYRAKEHDPNCGKQTELILMRSGDWKQVPERTLRQWEDVFDRIDRVSGVAARHMLGVKRNAEPIGAADQDEIERSFIPSSSQWSDHPLPIPKPTSSANQRVPRRTKRDR